MNRRVREEEPGKFKYNPPYAVKGKNSLIQLLRNLDMEVRGGFWGQR